MKTNQRIIFGIGVNDLLETKHNDPCYLSWKRMFARCYCKSYQKDFPSYKGCFVCEHWHKFSNFKKWYDENYVEGWHLDKDLMVHGCRMYSPATCNFLPPEINIFLAAHNNKRSIWDTGASRVLKNGASCFKSIININNKHIILGYYATEKEAHERYIFARKIRARQLARQYKEQLSKNAYEKLFDYSEEN